MRRRSFLFPLLFVASLFVVVRTVGADAPVAPPRFGSSPHYPFAWQLATNGEEYLLAWSTDTRTHFAALNERGEVIGDAVFDSGAHVADAIAVQRDYLVVLGASLLSVDADTLAVTRTQELPFSNSVLATDGVTALLANGGGFARIVDAEGDPAGPDFSFNQIGTAGVGAAGADGSYLLAWLESRQDDLRLVRSVVRDDGGNVSAMETLATLDPNRSVAFGRRGVASNGRNFLVSWRSDTKVSVALVSPYGEVLVPPATIAEWDYTDAPQVAWNGREFLVVLEARGVTGEADIIALRIDALGKPIGNATSVAGGPALQYHAAVATTGRSTLAVWGEFAKCYAAGFGGVLARTIEPLGPIATVSRGEGVREAPAAADVGGTSLVAWVERGALRGVRAALLPSGTEIDLGASTYSQDSPAVGTNGDAYLVVWPDLHDDCTTSLSAVVVDRNGRAGPVRTLAQNAHTKTRPAIAWNGSEYVVVWERTGAIQLAGLRVAADGIPIDTDPIAMTEAYADVIFYTHRTGFPAIVWTGQEYFATWTFSRIAYIPLYPDPPPILEVRARRFDRSLFPLGVESVLATPAYGSSLGWNGREALTLWQGSGGTHAARIAPDGSVLATQLLGPNTDPTPPSLSIAWTGYGWMAANGAQLLHLRADGSFQSRTDLGDSVRASTVTPTLVAYQRDEGVATEVFTRRLARLRRRAVSR